MAYRIQFEETIVATNSSGSVTYPQRRFTVGEYYRMADVGILDEDERVELIDGCIVVREPASPPHAGHTTRLASFFAELLGKRAIVSVQNPFRIDEFNHPQPDVALLRPRADFYTSEHPGPADAYLLVEVALTSLQLDRQTKTRIYAQAGIPEMWIVNLAERLVEVYRDRSKHGYRRIEMCGSGEPLSIAAFPLASLAVDDVLG